jgi:adenosylhomocysteine nucleosidase
VILIFYAFARELGPFRRRVSARAPIALGGLRGFRGRLGMAEVVCVATGLGVGRARDCARRAMELLAPDLVIATGVAGALVDEVQPGTLILADRLVLEGDGTPATITVPAVDLALFAVVMDAAGVPFTSATVLTSAQILHDGPAKRAARARTGAMAVDMESAAIAAEAASRGLRFGCVRAVLDRVDEEVVGAELAGPEGEVRPLAAAAFVLRNPGAIAALARMMRALNRATASLADALEALVRSAQ